ncbi:MAG: hypothetical protein IT320_20870 [Anaerolineae bacterium]|nr:hypothetical protein [Anaerolineae bacterium]
MKAKWARVKSTISSKTYAQKYGRDQRIVERGWVYPVDGMPEGQQQMLVAMGAIELLPRDYTPEPEEIAPQDTETRAALERQRSAKRTQQVEATDTVNKEQ